MAIPWHTLCGQTFWESESESCCKLRVRKAPFPNSGEPNTPNIPTAAAPALGNQRLPVRLTASAVCTSDHQWTTGDHWSDWGPYHVHVATDRLEGALLAKTDMQ